MSIRQAALALSAKTCIEFTKLPTVIIMESSIISVLFHYLILLSEIILNAISLEVILVYELILILFILGVQCYSVSIYISLSVQ